jgi:hypothetical protein
LSLTRDIGCFHRRLTRAGCPYNSATLFQAAAKRVARGEVRRRLRTMQFLPPRGDDDAEAVRISDCSQPALGRALAPRFWS